MTLALKHPAADGRAAIALKAFARIAEQWGLTQTEAAVLADMSESTWKRARKPGYAGGLTHDQMLRLSAVTGIYKSLQLYFGDEIAPRWMTLPNAGPLFAGVRPVDTLADGGLPQFLRVRNYLDALRGGA